VLGGFPAVGGILFTQVLGSEFVVPIGVHLHTNIFSGRVRDTVRSSVADLDPNQDPNPPDPHVLCLPDPDPLVRGMHPDPDPALDPDPSIIMQK
jgi:hypothetical protein